MSINAPPKIFPDYFLAPKLGFPLTIETNVKMASRCENRSRRPAGSCSEDMQKSYD